MTGCPSSITFGQDDHGRPVYHPCRLPADHEPRHTAIVAGTVVDSRGLPSVEVGLEVSW